MKKSINKMMDECKQIRRLLCSICANIDQVNGAKLSKYMDLYVKEQTSQRFTLKVNKSTSVIVTLDSDEKLYSGIICKKK